MTERGQLGAAAVETAVLVGVFLIPLLLGLVDISRAIYINIVIEEAAQEGALVAAFEGDVMTSAEVEQRVIDSISFPDLSAPDSTITIWCTAVPRSQVDGSDIVITVDHTLDPLTPFLPDLTLSQSAEAAGLTSCPAP